MISQDFEDTDVEFPILAVTELSQGGVKGTEVVFNQHEGHLTDNHTEKQSKFIRKKGVYFMKLFVPKGKIASPDFARPVLP